MKKTWYIYALIAILIVIGTILLIINGNDKVLTIGDSTITKKEIKNEMTRSKKTEKEVVTLLLTEKVDNELIKKYKSKITKKELNKASAFILLQYNVENLNNLKEVKEKTGIKSKDELYEQKELLVAKNLFLKEKFNITEDILENEYNNIKINSRSLIVRDTELEKITKTIELSNQGKTLEQAAKEVYKEDFKTKVNWEELKYLTIPKEKVEQAITNKQIGGSSDIIEHEGIYYIIDLEVDATPKRQDVEYSIIEGIKISQNYDENKLYKELLDLFGLKIKDEKFNYILKEDYLLIN